MGGAQDRRGAEANIQRHNGYYLEYPCGHTTLVVAVIGMVVLVSAGRRWAGTVAVAVGLPGMLGLIACGYHYMTDTIGAALLTSALARIAARLAGVVPAPRSSPLVGPTTEKFRSATKR
ncbi:MAG: phosphoesterase, PA-phosphatase related protein [Mycobacterium sp.]|jgi:membrane-associated phospholipid phosphatase|nr:phosphoesterase, PA-phosphatase related protein [Mycobacterium sp.]